MGHEKRPNGDAVPQQSGFEWTAATGPNFLVLALVCALFFRDVFLNPTKMLWASDIVRFHVPQKLVQWQAFWEWDTFPVWDPTVFCGKSIVGDPLALLFNPIGLIFWLIPSPTLFGPYLWCHVVLGAWGMFLLMRRKGCSGAGALFAGIAFALSGKTGAHIFAGHVEVVTAMMGLPWMLWAMDRAVECRTWRNAGVLALVFSLTAFCGSLQILYYHVLVSGAYALGAIADQTLRRERKEAIQTLLVLACGGVLFVGLTTAWWLPIVRNTLLLSARWEDMDYSVMTMNSAAYRDLFRLLWPFDGVEEPRVLASDAANAFFWETASYPGCVALALAVAAPFAVRRRDTGLYLFLAVGLVAVMLALGGLSPVHWLAVKVIPGFALWRAPGRFLFYANFAVAALAGLALSERPSSEYRWAPVATAVVFLMLTLFIPLAARDWWFDPARGRWIPIGVFALLSIGTYLWAMRLLRPVFWYALCLGVLTLELLAFWGPHINVVPPRQAMPPMPAAHFLSEETGDEPFRVLDCTAALGQQEAARQHLELAGGYHPAVPKHFIDLYNQLWRHDQSDFVEIVPHPPSELAAPGILDMMNIGYVFAREATAPFGMQRVYDTPQGAYPGKSFVFRRPSGVPRAYVVAKAATPPPGEPVPRALRSIQPRETCLVESDPIDGTAPYTPLTAERLQPGAWHIQCTTNEPGVLVLSEGWHPDWQGSDNGQPISLRQVNHGFLGAALPPGEHDLLIRFTPWDFYLGCIVSGVFGLVLLAMLAIPGVRWPA